MPDPTNSPVTRKSSKTEQTLSVGDRQIRYTAIAEWQTLFEQEKPVAEMFHVAYLAEAEEASLRPLTFVFNGGPGAASAYLHMGALGSCAHLFWSQRQPAQTSSSGGGQS